MRVEFTLSEACEILDPPMTEQQLRAVVRALGWKPSGQRRSGRAGHPHATYPAADLMRLHQALTPFLRR